MCVRFRLAAAVAHRLSSFVAALFISLQFANAADLTPHNIVAHGDADQFWIARIEQSRTTGNSRTTTIYARQLGQEGKWQPLTGLPLPAGVVCLADLNGQAAALLDDGSWVLLYPDATPFTAGPLPTPARMIAIAGGSGAWWAVGVVRGGIAALPTTRSAATQTAPSAVAGAATRAASQPAAERIVLFTLIGNDWQPRAEFPEPAASATVSLAMIDDMAYLADVADGVVRVRHLDKDHWVNDATFSGLPALAAFKLLGTSHVPRLWVQPQEGAEKIYSLNGHGTPPELAQISGASAADRTIAVATGKVRVVAVVKGDVVEQDYAMSDMRPDGGLSPVPLPRSSPVAQLQQFQFWLVVVALLLAAMGSFRQRAAMRGAGVKPESIALAPPGRRLAAGLIDAAPAIVALAFGLIHFDSGKSAADPNRLAIQMLICWCAAIFYIAYLTVVEVLAGRSPGKWLMNLRIVGVEGEPADTSALITRNLLRVIDAGILFLPLLMIVLMPLRQRAGDLAAGTLVVRGDVRPEPEITDEVAATGGTTTSGPEQS